MKISVKWICFLFAPLLLTFAASAQSSKQSIYNALASGNISVLNKQLKAVEAMEAPNRSAFEGILLMRKSGLQKTPAQKLSMFRQGRRLLEAAIQQAPSNLEYKFLRLMIQENAPKIVGYYKNLPEDAERIRNGYKSLPAVVRKAILSYSKTSKALSGLQ